MRDEIKYLRNIIENYSQAIFQYYKYILNLFNKNYNIIRIIKAFTIPFSKLQRIKRSNS